MNHLIDWMRDLLNSRAGIVIAFITSIGWIITSTLAMIKFVRTRWNTILGIGLMILLLLFGLVFPILILISSSWSGLVHITLNLLAIYGLLSFISLLYIMKVMSSSANKKFPAKVR